MSREKKYGNFHLNKKKLEELKSIFKNDEEINGLSIYTTRVIKKDSIKINNSETFKSIDELIEYIDNNKIDKIDLINIEVWYKKNKKISLEYDGIYHNWILKYQEKDNYTDSIVYNLNNLFKYKNIPLLSSFVDSFFWIFCLSYLIIRYLIGFKNIYFDIGYIILWIFFFLIIIFKSKCAYRENRFIERNKDSIFLSLIFYILGLVSPYIIKLIQIIFK